MTCKIPIYDVENYFNMMNFEVGEYTDCGRIFFNYKDHTSVEISNLKTEDVPEGLTVTSGMFDKESVDPGDYAGVKIAGTPKKAGKYVFYVDADVKYEGVEDVKKSRMELTLRVVDNSKDEDDDDDDSSSSDSNKKSYAERQAEEAKHFTPDTSTMTAEQLQGWNLVSREAPSVTSSIGGLKAVSAYQGPMCRLAFQLAAPGYNVGHTYDMTFANQNGSVSMKVPSDLAKSGRTFVISLVSGGQSVSTPPLTADANGNINFNIAALGLDINASNAAMAIMYKD